MSCSRGRRWYMLCLYHRCWECCPLCELETQAPFPSGTAQDSATEVIAITTTSPGLIRHLGLLMAVPCSLLIPGPWAGRGICEWSHHLNTLSLLWPLHDHNVAILHNTTHYYIFHFLILQNTTKYYNNTTKYYTKAIRIDPMLFKTVSILHEYYIKILHNTTYYYNFKYYKILRNTTTILRITSHWQYYTSQCYWILLEYYNNTTINTTYYYVFQYYAILRQYYMNTTSILRNTTINTTWILRGSKLGKYYIILR